jgi:hypothetical protein
MIPKQCRAIDCIYYCEKRRRVTGKACLVIKAIILSCALCAGTGGPISTLSLTDPVSKWFFVFEAERENVVSLLVALVGHGRQEMNEPFFEKCISDAAWEPNLANQQIRDVANACAYMSTLIFAESD